MVVAFKYLLVIMVIISIVKAYAIQRRKDSRQIDQLIVFVFDCDKAVTRSKDGLNNISYLLWVPHELSSACGCKLIEKQQAKSFVLFTDD